MWKSGWEKKGSKIAMLAFGIQLVFKHAVVNFFGAENPGLAFIDIVLLWVAILVYDRAFFKISKPQHCYLLPYVFGLVLPHI